MIDKLEKYSDQRFRKDAIYKAIRSTSVDEVTKMLGLGEDQTALTYKYSLYKTGDDYNENVWVPNDRWRSFEWELSKKLNKEAIKDRVAPEVIITLKDSRNLIINGCTLDELQGIVIELGEVEKHKESNKKQAFNSIKKARVLLDQLEAEIRNMS